MHLPQQIVHHTMVPHKDDVDTAVQFHLLKSIHQLANDSVNQSQRIVQLKHTRGVQDGLISASMTRTHKSLRTVRTVTYIYVHGSHFMSICVWLFRVHGINIRPGLRQILWCQYHLHIVDTM